MTALTDVQALLEIQGVQQAIVNANANMMKHRL